MDNQPYEPWDDAKLADWKKFWESDLGQEYLQKLEDIKQLIVADILKSAFNNESLLAFAGRAAGVDAIIQDIRAIVATATEKAKEGKKAKEK